MLATFNDIQGALEREEITPFFQPIVELRSGQLCGFEVLARWLHPKLGPILPANFISLAEDSGLISRLTYQILLKTFAHAHVVPSRLFLAVNVSPSELCGGELAQTVRAAADQTTFDLSRLVIEVTEAVLIEDHTCALKTALELREMGCRLALDDFGTGHSSLSQLRKLPFYGLKIDRTFVKPMVFQSQSRKIVASVIGLSTSLEMRTVAEGVENEEQASMLLWLGCEMAQGWLYGHPEPAEHLAKVLASSYISVSVNKEVQDDGLHALRAQHLALLQALYRGVPVGLCFVDLRQRYVSLNQRYAEFVGKPQSTFIGSTVQEMIPDIYHRVQPLLARALKGESIVNEEVLRSATEARNSATTALVSYEPVRDEAGELIGTSVAIFDISHQHSTDWPTPDDHGDESDISAKSLAMSWVRDARGNVKEVSSRWLALTGMTREQALNLGWLEALHPDDRALGISVLSEALQTRKPIDYTCRLRTTDGNYRWVRARGYPRYDGLGAFIGWYGGTEDIHETEELVKALREDSTTRPT